MSLGKLVVGVAAGVVAGVAVGILLAPEKGSDLREKISGGEYLDDIKEYWNDCLAELTDKLGWKEEALQFAHANVGGNDSVREYQSTSADSPERKSGSGEEKSDSSANKADEAEGAAKGGAKGGGAGARKPSGGEQ